MLPELSPRWTSRPVRPKPGTPGWIMSWGGHGPPEGLDYGMKVIYLSANAAARLVKGPDGKIYDIGRCAIDWGREWRIDCPWMPESHPRVWALLQRQIAQLQARRDSTFIPPKEGELRALNEDIARLQDILERNDYKEPFVEKTDDCPL